MHSSIAQSIKSLPPLSQSIIDINKIHADPESSVMDLAKVIEGDPMILANLLKAANSPLYGFAKDIHKASQAVSLFGMNMTRSIALSQAVRKLLNVDMQPYGISSEKFAELCELQASCMRLWYTKIDKSKAEKLYLASFLQETGKILIANAIIQEEESTAFYSELELTNNVTEVEKMYLQTSSSKVTAKVFEYWNFDADFVQMIHYADTPEEAPKEIQEFAMALHIVKAIVPINKPLDEISRKIGLEKARKAGYDTQILADVIETLLKK